jgi:hypothetical protein
MLASTVQFSRNAPHQPPATPPQGRNSRKAGPREDNPAPQGAGSLRTQQRAQPHQPQNPRSGPGGPY